MPTIKVVHVLPAPPPPSKPRIVAVVSPHLLAALDVVRVLKKHGIEIKAHVTHLATKQGEEAPRRYGYLVYNQGRAVFSTMTEDFRFALHTACQQLLPLSTH